jgi:acid phosphatase (class A)
MKRTITAALLITAAFSAPAHAQTPVPPAVAAPAKTMVYLSKADFQPVQILPAPAARGSAAEAFELAELHALIAQTSPERMAQARWDDAHEDPSIFNAALGLDLASMPATWALLKAVQWDANLAVNDAKVYFARVRPWGVDPTMPNCDAGKGKQPTRGYPSGHAMLGYSVGYVLAQLMPAKASVILARSADYALSREICGVHFPSDQEASHVIATLAAQKLLADPRLADQLAAARKELASK